MAEDESLLLSELCTICHIHPPKYRCPRCSTRTCSFACTKRHKLWSQCSGIRDPATYLRKHDLATPSAFDKDFNFISGIERRLERAERDAEHRGVVLDPGDDVQERARNTPIKGEVSLQRGIERSGVIVGKAPKGMTRSKQNTTHWHRKRKCLSWTLEWITMDGQKLLGNCVDTCSLSEAYFRIRPLREPATKKRKLDTNDDPSALADLQDNTSTVTTPVEEAGTASPAASTNIREAEPELYFYLHRPYTTSKVKVVISLPHDMTIADALQGRVVLEFPTFLVLPNPPESLPDGYMLEESFLDQYRAEESSQLSDIARLKQDEQETGLDGENGPLIDIDENKVLDVLRKDLGYQPDAT